MQLFEELEARGLVHQVTEQDPPLAEKLRQGSQTVYAGFDPTAASLHVGSLIPLLGLRRFQLAGHRVIALAGGATGLVGDPSGRSEERNLLDSALLEHNLTRIKGQLEKFLDFSGQGAPAATLVDNLEWTRELTLLEFLRDTGKHFTLNAMLRKDSVQNRLEREGEGISYTEFTYMLLQAHDFLHLFQRRGCTIQVGGSDQWGNITCGVELIRRKLGQSSYGLTFPLLTNSDGSKFGKSVRGAVWLDPAMTSPFAFRQFWFRTPDADVVQRLRYFTFLPLDEVAALERGVLDRSAPNEAQRALARAMTELVHGRDEAERVERAVDVLFRGGELAQIPLEYLADAFEGAPVTELPRERLRGDGLSWLDLVVDAVYGGGQKRGAARRDMQGNALSLNGERLADPEARITTERLLHDRYLVVRKGKSGYHLVRVVD